MRLILTFACIAIASAANAQTAAPRPMLSEACRTEVLALCPKTEDRAARRQCLISNREKLSAGCKQELVALRGARKDQRSAGNAGDMAAPGAMTPAPQPQ